MIRKQFQQNDDANTPAFLLGQLPDLLFGIKRISDTLGNTRNDQSSKVAISKLKLLLKRYSGLMDAGMKENICLYIQDIFKKRKISRRLARKIVSWWFKNRGDSQGLHKKGHAIF